jgi:hypothetical protein
MENVTGKKVLACVAEAIDEELERMKIEMAKKRGENMEEKVELMWQGFVVLMEASGNDNPKFGVE